MFDSFLFLDAITGAQSFSSAYFGQGTGPIQIDNVGCSGSESVLVQCSHITNDNCGHHEDAGVRCKPPGISNSFKAVIIVDFYIPLL